MSNSPINGNLGPKVEFDSAVLQHIRRHARGSMEAEICGVLIGDVRDGVTRVEACITGEKATEGGAHVTFTQQTWEHIYKVKDTKFAESSIVGWYHSHPGFGIFLSDYDLFIQENFFAASHQVAWVFDPHSDEEGCFGWVSGEIAPIQRITVLRQLSETYRAAAGVTPDVRSADRPHVQRHKIARLPFFGFNKWRSCALIILILLVGYLLYRQMPHYKTKTTTPQSATPRQTISEAASKSESDAATLLKSRLSSPKVSEILIRPTGLIKVTNRDVQSVTIERGVINCKVTYDWTSAERLNGSTTYRYVYDLRTHKVDRFVSSTNSWSGKTSEELSRIAKKVGKMLFQEN